VYTSDEDDGSTSGKELKEKGYTLPEYHFVAEYGDVKSEPGPVLEVKDWVHKQLVDKETKHLLSNRRYLLWTADNQFIEKKTDAEGYVEFEKLIFGDHRIILLEEN
jgi:uncharacterized surface anchored protein